MPVAPSNMSFLRPTLSTYRTAGMVASSMAMPTTPVARRLVVLLDCPKAENIEGA